jgi:hypothetical protein
VRTNCRAGVGPSPVRLIELAQLRTTSGDGHPLIKRHARLCQDGALDLMELPPSAVQIRSRRHPMAVCGITLTMDD